MRQRGAVRESICTPDHPLLVQLTAWRTPQQKTVADERQSDREMRKLGVLQVQHGSVAQPLLQHRLAAVVARVQL